jgi:hypothetical protein
MKCIVPVYKAVTEKWKQKCDKKSAKRDIIK